MSFADLVRRFVPRHLLSAREAYELWADTYPPWTSDPVLVAEEAVVEPMIRAAQPVRALDVGTGTGRYLTIMAAAGARLVVGIDVSEAMLARDASGQLRVCGDARQLPCRAASVDLVCSSLMVGEVDDLGGWLREAARVLSPGGHLIYSDFHPCWLDGRVRRTFRVADGRVFELTGFAHDIDDHLARLQEVGLDVKTIREPRLAGRSAPAIVVFHAVKPGRTAHRS